MGTSVRPHHTGSSVSPGLDKKICQLPCRNGITLFRSDIVCPREGRILRLRAGQHEIGGQRFKHVLEGPYGIRVPHHDRFSLFTGAHTVRHQAVLRPVAPADHISRPRC